MADKYVNNYRTKKGCQDQEKALTLTHYAHLLIFIRLFTLGAAFAFA